MKKHWIRSTYFIYSIFAASVAVSSLSGCGTVSKMSDLEIALGANSNHRSLKLYSTWVRDTKIQPHFKYRYLNLMPPLLLEEAVLQGNPVDGITKYDRKSGVELWRIKVENGVIGGATADRDRLYFGGGDGQFHCVSLNDGKTIWVAPVRSETLAAPTVSDGVVFFQSGADIVFALDANSGKQLWVYNRRVTGHLSIRASTRPVIAGDKVFVGFSDGYLAALKRTDGSIIWERRLGHGHRFSDVDATPVIDGESLYVSSYDGQLYSLNVDTGDVLWKVNQGGYVPVTVHDDRIYFSTLNQSILLLDKKSGKTIKTFPVKNGIPTQAVLHNGLMIYGESDGNLVVASAESGETLAQFAPGTGVIAKPTIFKSDTTSSSSKSNPKWVEGYFVSNGANLHAVKFGYVDERNEPQWIKK